MTAEFLYQAIADAQELMEQSDDEDERHGLELAIDWFKTRIANMSIHRERVITAMGEVEVRGIKCDGDCGAVALPENVGNWLTVTNAHVSNGGFSSVLGGVQHPCDAALTDTQFCSMKCLVCYWTKWLAAHPHLEEERQAK